MSPKRKSSSSTMRNHGNIVSHTHKNTNSPENKLKVMGDCVLTNREFEITVMKKLSKLQENLERHFNELRNKINEQKEYITKETETLKKNQTNSEAKEFNK